MSQIRVLLGFAQASDHSVEETAGSVLENYYGNPAFPNPVVSQTTLQGALTGFTDAIAATSQGGSAATAIKDDKRQALITFLRVLAADVQTRSENVLATLLSSGFEAVSTNRASTPLDKPSILDILNKVDTQLHLRVSTIRNARNYELRYSSVAGDWSPPFIFGKAREMIVTNLTPGVLYTFQVRALGGSTGHSDWSDAVSHRSL
jgi:hypothetical protein